MFSFQNAIQLKTCMQELHLLIVKKAYSRLLGYKLKCRNLEHKDNQMNDNINFSFISNCKILVGAPDNSKLFDQSFFFYLTSESP